MGQHATISVGESRARTQQVCEGARPDATSLLIAKVGVRDEASTTLLYLLRISPFTRAVVTVAGRSLILIRPQRVTCSVTDN